MRNINTVNSISITYAFLLFIFLGFFALCIPTSYAQAQYSIPSSITEALSTTSLKQLEDSLENRLSEIPTVEEVQQDMIQGLLRVDMTPENPKPYEEVTVRIKSFITDLNRGEISWYVNDKLALQGFGKTLFTFTAGDFGSVARIDIVMHTVEGVRTTKRIIVRPADIDFMWEAFTYTPPFYKGKALLSPESFVKIVALPHLTTSSGRKIPSNELVYDWQEEGQPVDSQSGYGKNVYITKAPKPFWDQSIEVEVSSLGGILTTKKKVVLVTITPEVVVYEDSPLQGVLYGKAIGDDFSLTQSEVTLRAEPYFFANADIKNNLIYTWLVDNNNVENTGNKITLQANEGASGLSFIKIAIENIAQNYQADSHAFQVSFEKSGFLGF